MPKYDLAQTYRSMSGDRRITYRPDHGLDAPWASYYKGTASMHFNTIEAAVLFYFKHGDPLIITKHE